MSNIIECPECSTRYKMNQPIPEEGRLVKCAKCGHQWRLIPEGESEQTLELAEPEHNDDAGEENHAAHEQSEYGWDRQDQTQNQDEADDVYAHRHEPAAPLPSWQQARDPFASGISTLSEPQSMGYADEIGYKADDENAGADSWAFRQVAMDAEKKAVATGERTRSSFFGLFGRSSKRDQQDEDIGTDASLGEGETGWTPPIARGWPHTSGPVAGRMDEQAGDNGEDDIRRALKAALEQPDDTRLTDDRESEAQPQSWLGQDDDEAKIRWNPFGSNVGSDAAPSASLDDEGRGSPESDKDYDRPGRSFEGSGYDFTAKEADDQPFRLSGEGAKAPIYRSDRDDDASGDDRLDDNSRLFQSDIENVFKSGSPLKKPRFQAPVDDNEGIAASEFDRIYDGQFGAAGYESTAAEDLERDAAALQAELESTDLATRYETAGSRGGLATAAAWAVFVSLISGVMLALTVFRNDIMAAFPGTADLYQSIGFSVPDSGVDFADVSYRWTVSDGKPMIEVRGQVVNITDRTVTVPRVLINVRDTEKIGTVKATASVPADTLAPRESASFTLEFLSPPQNISQIELEFDRRR